MHVHEVSMSGYLNISVLQSLLVPLHLCVIIIASLTPLSRNMTESGLGNDVLIDSHVNVLT